MKSVADNFARPVRQKTEDTSPFSVIRSARASGSTFPSGPAGAARPDLNGLRRTHV